MFVDLLSFVQPSLDLTVESYSGESKFCSSTESVVTVRLVMSKLLTPQNVINILAIECTTMDILCLAHYAFNEILYLEYLQSTENTFDVT